MGSLQTVTETSRRLAGTRSRKAKGELIAACLEEIGGAETALAVAYLCGRPPQGRIGVGQARVAALQAAPSATARLSLSEVDRTFTELAAQHGSGSAQRRQRLLGALLGAATGAEQDFLRRLLLGELRQGALEGVMLEALARALRLPAAALRRAYMLAGDLPRVAAAAAASGAAGLGQFELTLFRPVRPMLARAAEDPVAALAELGEAALEYKLDGARIQVHRQGDRVEVYTRQLHPVSERVPELLAQVLALPARELILDGEALALDASGRPLPFQVSMRRFGSHRASGQLRRELPLSGIYFDCLLCEGQSLIDAPGAERSEVLAGILPSERRVARRVTAAPAEARAFFEAALAAGHEGVMAKSLAAPYAAGQRGGNWLKLKQAHTLDLVVLAAEWGSGRRRGRLSNLHLGARDPAGGFVMLGKTFKGLTDALLEWQTGQLLQREVARRGAVVEVRPELVVEIAFNELQRSPHYPAGLALRFARVKGYRIDKTADQADTIDTVRALFERQGGLGQGRRAG